MSSLKQLKKDIDKYRKKSDEVLSRLKELETQAREIEDKDIIEAVRKDLSYEEFIKVWNGLKERRRAAEELSITESEENTDTERKSENEA